MNKEKIFITGMGIISALGNSLDDSLKALQKHQINAGKNDLFDSKIDKPVFKADLPSKPSLEMRSKELAKYAFDQAITQAKLKDKNHLKIGICCGTTVASQLNDIEFYKKFRAGEVKSFSPVENFLSGNISESLLKEYNFSGPGFNVVNACSSGTDAIGVAMTWLQNGVCDIAIAGGADELNLVPIAGFNALGILSDSVCKPFDKDRAGLNLGEGAAFLVLEKESTAKFKNTKFHAQCLGYSIAADAYHLTSPRPDGRGIISAIEKALYHAGLKKEDIGFINAHGTATKNNDLVEGTVFKTLFPKTTKILSTKGFTGHTLGAAGAIDAVLTILSLQNQWLPASAGFSEQDPEIGFSPVTKPMDLNANFALSTSLAFGGKNSALIFGRI